MKISAEDSHAYYLPLLLRLSAKLVSQLATFFSHKKSANSTFSQSNPPKQTGKDFFPNRGTNGMSSPKSSTSETMHKDRPWGCLLPLQIPNFYTLSPSHQFLDASM
jgi:hypothetical protein